MPELIYSTKENIPSEDIMYDVRCPEKGCEKLFFQGFKNYLYIKCGRCKKVYEIKYDLKLEKFIIQ